PLTDLILQGGYAERSPELLPGRLGSGFDGAPTVARRRAKRKVEAKRCANAGFALHGDLGAVVAHHGLHNRQPETGAVLLRSVVGRKQAFVLLLRKPKASVGDLRPHVVFI